MPADAIKPFSGHGSTPARKRFWNELAAVVNSIQKQAGRHVTVDVHPGRGTVINVAAPDQRGRHPLGVPPGATGACCVGADCSIRTAAECAALGGDYQGNGTVCDPNPCPTTPCCGGCGIDGTAFLTKIVHLTSTTHCTAFGDTQTSSADITTRIDVDPATCIQTVTCFGSASGHNCPDAGDHTYSWSSCAGSPDLCGYDEGGSCTGDPLHHTYCFGGGGGCPAGALGNQLTDCTSHLDNGVCLIDVTVTVAYSNPCNDTC